MPSTKSADPRPEDAADHLAEIFLRLSHCRFAFNSEADLQAQIAAWLVAQGESFEREYPLDAKSRPDFFAPGDGLALEVKVSVGTSAILRQLARYAAHPRVNGILLISSRPHHLPTTLAGKPMSCFAVWRSGL